MNADDRKALSKLDDDGVPFEENVVQRVPSGWRVIAHGRVLLCRKKDDADEFLRTGTS